MKLGEKIYQLRKLSGMTQEQLADKLNVTRQTLSKWENETSIPDIESVVRLSALFHTSLEELLLEEDNRVEEKRTQITLEDMMRINAHNRKMNLLLCSGLLFLAIGIIIAAFERMLEATTESLAYTLYRYIAAGQYDPAPVNYTRLMFPAILAGITGLILCLCYVVRTGKNEKRKLRKETEKNENKKGEENRKKYYVAGLGVLLLAAVWALAGFGKEEKKSNEDLYGSMIAGLGDEEQFSLRDIGEKNNVLFTTDMTYDDGNGHNAAVYCNVYYNDGENIYPLGKIESMGTAYPISYGNKCIYTASQHSIERYAFDKKIKGWIITRYEESFDADGNASYQYTENGKENAVSEREFQKAMEEYGKSTVVGFGYGASDNP